MFWFKSGKQLILTQLLTYSPHPRPSDIGKRIRRVNARKFMGWDKNSLTVKAKAVHAKQNKPSPGKQGSIACNSYFERQMP